MRQRNDIARRHWRADGISCGTAICVGCGEKFLKVWPTHKRCKECLYQEALKKQLLKKRRR